MNGHTPGPWSVGDESGNDGEAEAIVTTDRTITICWTADTWDEDEDEGVITDEDRANARLIAAAPDLLAAARLANQELIDLGVGSSGSPALVALWAAINKAEGRGE